jgi:hypothetical protein
LFVPQDVIRYIEILDTSCVPLCNGLVTPEAVLIDSMRLAGFLLLPSGWALVIAAIVLLAAPSPRTAFVFAGLGVELLGLVLLVRSHIPPRRERF